MKHGGSSVSMLQQHELKDVSGCRDLNLTEHDVDECDIQRAAVGLCSFL